MKDGNRLITIESESKHYGNAFMISKKWKDNVNSYWKISDRISVLQLKTSKSRNRNRNNEVKNTIRNTIDHVITIINVYAPTTERAKKHPKELKDMCTQPTKSVNDLKKLTSIVFIAGDFNAKIGMSNGTETCMVQYSRGRRNDSGERLIDFCESNGKYICNSSFQHSAQHITTIDILYKLDTQLIFNSEAKRCGYW